MRVFWETLYCGCLFAFVCRGLENISEMKVCEERATPALHRDKLHERLFSWNCNTNITIRLMSGRVESASRPRVEFMFV